MINRGVLLLTGAIGVIGSNSLALSPIAAEVATSFDVSTADVLIGSAAYGIGVAASALALAPQIDRFGADRALVWAIGVLTAALAATALAPSVGVMAAAQGVAGLAAGAALPAIYALTAQIAETGRESETLGVVLTGWTVSLVAGVSVAALIADFAHWRLVFGLIAAAAAGLCAAAAAYDAWGVRPPPAEGAASPIAALGTPGAPAALAAVAGYMTAFYGAYVYLGPHLVDTLGLSTSLAGVAALVYGVFFALAQPLDRWIDSLGRARAGPIVFAALSATYAVIAAAASSPVAIIAAFGLLGLVNHLGLNLLVAGISALNPSRRGALLGLYSATTYSCMSVGAIGFRPLYDGVGFAGVALAAAALAAPPALVFRRRPTSKGGAAP